MKEKINVLKIPYYTQVLNSVIPPFCIKLPEYKIPNEIFILIFYSSLLLENKSETLKSARGASRDFMRILISCF